MMKHSQIIAILILCTCSSITVHAQEIKVIQDFRANMKVGVQKTFFKDLEISFETVLKLERDATRIDEVDFDLDVEYSPLRFLSIGAGYRLALNQRSDSIYYLKHRYMAELSLKQAYRRFKFGYRFRYQNVDDDFFLYEGTSVPENIFRNKIQVKYDIQNSRITPFLFMEHYGSFRDYYPFGLKIKTGIGARYSLKKYGLIKIYYRIDREINTRYPFTYYTMGLAYLYDL